MGRYYVDTSALMKRAYGEAESRALRSWFDGNAAGNQLLFTSALTVVEVERGLRSLAARGLPLNERIGSLVPAALAGLSVTELTNSVLQMARWIGPDNLRSLDAIHLATAVLNGAAAMVTYDQRLAEAAKTVGLSVITPA